MHINTIYAALFGLLNLFFVACGNNDLPETKGQTLFVEHYVRYDEEDKIVKATATFKLGDSLHRAKAIVMPEPVSLNGTILQANTSDAGTNYNIEGTKTKFEAAYRFSFTHPLTHKPFETEFLMRQISNLRVESGVLNKKTVANTLKWDGEALANGETLSLRIEDSAGNNNEINIVGAGGNTPEYTFRGGQLDGIALGKAKVYAVRTAYTPIGSPQTAIKGTLQTEFLAQPFEVEIKP